MTYRYIKHFFRSSKDIEFYQESPEFLAYVKEVYIDTGKCFSFRERSFFDDEELVLVLISVWANKEYGQEFLNDPQMFVELEKAIAYNEEHKIRLLDILDS